MTTADQHPDEKSPLRPSSSTITAGADSSSTGGGIIRKTLNGIMKAFESFLNFAPFVVVLSLQSSVSPIISLGAGSLAALIIIFYSMLKDIMISKISISKIRPKVLDVGQFLLFGFLFVLACIAKFVSPYAGELLVLWFNPFTTGGMALIMYTSIISGKPFVYDEAKAQMPPPIWERLSSKNWFLEKLEDIAWFWTKSLFAMTVVVAVQPLLVTLFYRGNVDNDTTGFMATLGAVLNIVQFAILFYALFTQYWEGSEPSRITKRVSQVKKGGLSDKEKALYGSTPIDVSISSLEDETKFHRIKSLTAEQDIDLAAAVLVDAFSNDEMFRTFYETDAGRQNFFSSAMKSFAYFNHVFSCYDAGGGDHDQKNKPAAVMACLPVYSKSQEEVKVFNTFKAWKQHGFEIPGGSMYDFPLPGDEFMELMEMRSLPQHGLTKNPYLYIAYFGADSHTRGKGYGRSLLKYIIAVSESKKVPLVLETGSAFNISNYEKYGFKVAGRVKNKPNWALMIRPITGHEVTGVEESMV